VYDNVSKSVSAQEPNPQSLAFNGDGTRMYVAGSNNQRVYQYDLSTAFNVSTATYNSVSFLVSSQESNPWDILFNNNGTKMYIIGPGSDTVYQYSLSSAYDVSTASYDSVSFSVFAQDTGARGMSFNNDGTALFVTGNSSDAVWQYNLTTAYDMSTASYSGYNFSVAPQENNPSSINFNSDGTKFFVMGWSGDDVNQYSTQVYTDVLVGTAISATKINMKNRS
jgi:sugar lactone lactonase YvrE